MAAVAGEPETRGRSPAAWSRLGFAANQVAGAPGHPLSFSRTIFCT